MKKLGGKPADYKTWHPNEGRDKEWVREHPLPKRGHLLYPGAALGGRRYKAVDPLFGQQRADTTQRLEATLGNKLWRWRDSRISLVASLEHNRSNIGFYSYRKFNLSIAVE